MFLKVQGNGHNQLWPFLGLRNEINRLFDNTWREPVDLTAEKISDWSPLLDLAESDKEVTIRAEVPGIDPEHIDISVNGNELVISGEKKETIEKNEQGYHHKETRYGKFSRTVTLPDGIDSEKVSADYDKGVLVVKLPKSPVSVAKKIPVKAR
jgi:HSP20 family protein